MRRFVKIILLILFSLAISPVGKVYAQFSITKSDISDLSRNVAAKNDMLELANEHAAEVQQKLLLENQLARQKMFNRKAWETLLILIIGYLIILVFIRVVNRRVINIKAKHILRKNIVYLVTSILCVIIFFIWMQNIGSLTIFLGVASAGLALALQEVILSLAGWMLIMMRRPYELGDRIEINGIKGDIIDIRVFQTILLEIGNWVDADQSTGRIVNIPNSFVFKHANYNYSRGFEFIWNEMPILVTFESDWKKGKKLMLARASQLAGDMEDAVRRKLEAMKNRYMIYYGTLTPIVYVNIKDSGIELTLRYLTEAKKRRSTQHELCGQILEDFGKEPDINFAYPTYRIVKN